jgi:hypothetical protein
LLSLNGIDVGEMAWLGKAGQSGEHATLPVPQVLLMEVLELREALAEAHAAKDAERDRSACCEGARAAWIR